MTIVENVDEDGRPVPDGQPGARLLVSSLFNRTQPLIRLEPRARRRRRARSRPLPVRAHAAAHPLDPRTQRRRARAARHGRRDRLRAPAAVRGRRPRPRRGRVPGRPGKAPAYVYWSSPAARRQRSRRGYAAQSSSACANSGSLSRSSRSSAGLRYRASRAASSSSSWPTAAPARRRSHLIKHGASAQQRATPNVGVLRAAKPGAACGHARQRRRHHVPHVPEPADGGRRRRS